MKKHTLIGIGVTTSAIALAATLVTAQIGASGGRRGGSDQQIGHQSRGGRGPAGRIGPLGRGRAFGGELAGLNLTDDQRAQVSEIRRAGRDQAGPVEQELRAAQHALHRELFADARDAAKVADLSSKVAVLQKQLAELHVKTASSVADVLTAEQRAAIRERGRRGGPGRGSGR